MRGGRGYLPLHCHHQNDCRIQIGSDESHFNVSLIVRDKVTRRCPQTKLTTLLKRKESRRAGVFLQPLVLVQNIYLSVVAKASVKIAAALKIL